MILAALAATALFAHPAAPQVTVLREGETWRAVYKLPSDERGWTFNRSAPTREDNASWRVGHWKVMTEGVKLENRDGADMLVATRGTVPRTVELRFVPTPRDLLADYEPALAFSDGSLALFTGHFDVMPAGSENGLVNELTLEAPGQTILVGGKVHRGKVAMGDKPTYALFGKVDAIETPYLTAFVDPGLPEWAHDELIEFMPAALEYYAGAMGERGDDSPPTIMVSWKGATPRMAGLSGSALDGLVAMSIEGEGVVQPDAMMGHRMRWFIAHEAAHFWLGQVVQYDKPGDAWIMEGGADVAAMRAVADLREGFDARAEERREWQDCQTSLAKGSLPTARERGDFRMPYACGAVLMLGAEAVSGDYFAFVRDLFAAEEADGFASTEDWLEAFRRAGASRSAVRLARRIATEQVDDPAALLAAYARATGATIPEA